jgi:dimethylaniline monooxygenase (N-oxide forming)
MAPVTVCVVGGGPIGMVAMKTFLEEGFQVVGFESRAYLGGLWKGTQDSTISAHATTVFNNSKWRSAFSDFPFDEDAETFPTAAQILKYLEDYAERFGLQEYYHLSTKVLRMQFSEKNPKPWAVTVQDLKSGKVQTHHFNKILIATGAYQYPRWPKFENIEGFQGKVIHSVDFHQPEEFRGKNVLTIGIHGTAHDVGVALESHGANHIYMSHRQGLLLLSRFQENGATFDSTNLKTTLFTAWLNKRFSRFYWWLTQQGISKQSQKSYPKIPESWGLSPAPSMAVRPPVLGDALWRLLTTGVAESVPAVRRITGPKSVELTDGRIIEDLDAIIYCTGYSAGGMPNDLAFSDDTETVGCHPHPPGYEYEEPRLYRNIFPLHENENIRMSLAYLGLGFIPVPGFVQYEMTAAAICQIWKHRTSLPSLQGMKDWHAWHLNERSLLQARYSPLDKSTFYPVFLNLPDQLKWIDSAAGAGIYQNLSWGWINWRAWKLWLQDRQFYNLLQNGVFTPAIWRLFRTGKRRAASWDECKQMIISENRRAEVARKARLEESFFDSKM